MGIFHLLDENSQIAGNDENLASKLKTACASHPNFVTPKMGKTNFIVVHTPREVEYITDGFKAKNKDEIGKNLMDTIQSSGNPMIQDLVNFKTEGKQKTLGSKFR